ncbi:hypothetical protein Hanom_Chr16g01444581 [Helianthus anomalus]
MTTRAKAGAKRKKPSEPSGDAPHIEQQIHDFISERSRPSKANALLKPERVFWTSKPWMLPRIKESPSWSRENKAQEKQVLVASMTANKERLEITKDAKVSVATVILKTKLKMTREAADASFDRADWDTAGWRQRL